MRMIAALMMVFFAVSPVSAGRPADSSDIANSVMAALAIASLKLEQEAVCPTSSDPRACATEYADLMRGAREVQQLMGSFAHAQSAEERARYSAQLDALFGRLGRKRDAAREKYGVSPWQCQPDPDLGI